MDVWLRRNACHHGRKQSLSSRCKRRPVTVSFWKRRCSRDEDAPSVSVQIPLTSSKKTGRGEARYKSESAKKTIASALARIPGREARASLAQEAPAVLPSCWVCPL